MKTAKPLNLARLSLLMMVFTIHVSAQTYQLKNDVSTLKVEGTSNLHDWQIVAEKKQGTLMAEVEDGKITKIQQLDFSVTAESLKSGKSGMDKNTYKALNTGKYKHITFKLIKVNSIDCLSQNSCKVSVTGNLTIAGVTKAVEIAFDLRIYGSKILIMGNKTLKMTDFGVDPPKAMFGTITTGDAIDIKFESSFLK